MPVNQSRLSIRLMANRRIGLLALRWGIVHSRWALWSTPVALPNKECTSNHLHVTLTSRLVHNILLCFYNSSCLSLVVYTENFGAQLEGLAGGRGGERLEKGDAALAVKDAAGVEFWDVGDGNCGLGGVEINYFLGCVLECCTFLARLEDGLGGLANGG
jgi:hypothetical protein